MADELEPVEQRFTADLTDYVEPIQAAADDTQELADVVDELQGGLDGLSGSMDDTAASAEGLAEGERSFRDAVYEANPGIDDQTASLLADAAAAEAAGLSLDEFAVAERVAGRDATGLLNTLTEVKDILGAAELGETLTVTKSGLNDFRIATDEEVTSLHGLRDAERDTRLAIIETDETYMAARTAMDAYRDSLGGLQDAITAMESGGGAGAGGGFAGGIVRLFAGSGMSGGALAGNLGALATGMVLIAPAIAAIIVELAGLVSGFTAAALGIGAFALLALPTFEKIKTAMSDTPAQLKKLPESLQAAVHGIDQLKSGFDKLAGEEQPAVLTILNQGLGIAAQLMPVVGGFAKAAAPAIESVMTSLAKHIDSKGFKDFVTDMERISPGAIEAIGNGLIHLGGAFGKLLTVMSKHDVIHTINVLFDGLADALEDVADWISRAMNNWDRMTGALKEGVKDIDQWSDDILIDGGKVLLWFEALPGNISKVLSSLPDVLELVGKNTIDGLLHGIESAAGGLLGEVSKLAGDVSHAFAAALSIFSPSLVFHEHGVNIVDGLIQGLDSRKPALMAAMAGLAGGVAGSGPGAAGTVNVRITGDGSTGGIAGALATDPRVLQQIQQVVQEATLRHNMLNATNGLSVR